MRYRSWMMLSALMGALSAQTPTLAVPPAPLPVPEGPSEPALDPLAGAPELASWTRQVTFHSQGVRAKVQAILTATFRPVEENGLGMVYENSYTRSVKEVWEEKRANCMGLTAFLVAACKSIGITARFAEPVNMNHWRREGGLIRIERHVVALIHIPPLDDLVADFMPQLRQKKGVYFVDILGEPRVRALFHANRAVELLGNGDTAAALKAGRIAAESDPTSATAWNIQGVVYRALKMEALGEASYRKAHLLNPKDGAPIGNLEQQMRDLGRTEEAEQFRALSLETRKNDPYFNAFLAEEAFVDGRVADALDLIRTAIKLLPYDPELHLAEAKFRLDQGKPEEAKKSLENARRWAQPQERERYDSKLALLAKR